MAARRNGSGGPTPQQTARQHAEHRHGDELSRSLHGCFISEFVAVGSSSVGGRRGVGV